MKSKRVEWIHHHIEFIGFILFLLFVLCTNGEEFEVTVDNEEAFEVSILSSIEFRKKTVGFL